MNVKTYHVSLGFPEYALRQIERVGTVRVRYTRHAQMAAIDDRYGVIQWLPKFVHVNLKNVVEVEVLPSGELHKIIVRLPYDDRRDLTLVLLPGSGWCVPSLWSNEVSDHHQTLNKSRYCLP